MRVLWFTNTPSCYMSERGGYNGGGWLTSLESELSRHSNIELGISFLMNGQPEVVEKNGVKYYPISRKNTGLFNKLHGEEDKTILKGCLKCINLFKPDIINVYGTERCFSLVKELTNVPVVVHIQGLLIPYVNAFFPPAISFVKYIFSNNSLRGIISRILQYNNTYVKGAIREKKILRLCKHYIGRTPWDKNLIELYNPNASYYYGSEILRPAFYKTEGRLNRPKTLSIVTTISDIPYKGFDVILKCSEILKAELKVDFEWNVFGNFNVNNKGKKIRKQLEENHVILRGVADATTLIEYLTKCTCFVYPSYIDNSPNSVCEAQILGCPVIAQYVGGVPSLIEHGVTGILVPANDPYQMAIYIKRLYDDNVLNNKIGFAARNKALERHNPSVIADNLIRIYKQILNTEKFEP